MSEHFCIKCENQTATVSWHKGRLDCKLSLDRYYTVFFDGEHLHFVCTKCGYSWSTPCADASKEVGE